VIPSTTAISKAKKTKRSTRAKTYVSNSPTRRQRLNNHHDVGRLLLLLLLLLLLFCVFRLATDVCVMTRCSRMW